MSVATVYAQLAHMADKTNNAFVLMNTLMLRMGNTSNEVINAQGMAGLATCARNLNKKREILAEVQRSVQVLEAEQGPDQLCLDNCDTKGHHSTVAYTQTETTDTTHLSTEAPSPETVMSLFTPDILNLSKPELEDELMHLQYVAMLALANYLTGCKEELAHWSKFLPKHHSHPKSHLPLEEAHVRLEPILNFKV